MTTSARTEHPPPALRVAGAFVDAQVGRLQARLLGDRRDAASVAALARLRRGVGKPPGARLDILEHTYSDGFRPSPTGAAGYEEWAAHVAITSWAAHQQSRSEPMHRRGRGLGTALRALPASGLSDGPLVRRFQMLGTAGSFDELTYHLRGSVQLLRSGGVALDYALLADQLVDWRWPDRRDRVLLRWGREFYRTRAPDGESTAQS